MIIFLTFYFLSSCAFFLIGMLAFGKDCESRTNRFFLYICILLTWWSCMRGLMVSAPSRQIASLFDKGSDFSWCFLYGCLLHFAIVISGKKQAIRAPWKVALLYAPGLLSFLIFAFEPSHDTYYQQTKFGWVYNHFSSNNIFEWFFVIYVLLYVTATAWYLYTWRKHAIVKRERKQATLILMTFLLSSILGILADLVLHCLHFTSLPTLGIIFATIPVAAIYYSISKYKFLSLAPQNLALEFITIMNEGFIIMDESRKIREVNKGALQLLGYREKEITGVSISKIAPDNLTEHSRQCGIKTHLINKSGERVPVLLSYSVLRDQFNEKTGGVLIFQSILEIDRFESQLEQKVSERTEKLVKEIKMRKEAEEKITRLANYDSLTGLPNRRLLFKRLDQAVHLDKKMFAILYLDLDLFKNINDNFGHQIGDDLLREVSARLLMVVNKRDTVARIGGDEFLILLRSTVDTESVEKAAFAILSKMKEKFNIGDEQIYITTSMGISLYPNDGKDITELIKNADISLYKAKELGKNRFVLCSQLLKNQAEKENQLTNELFGALKRQELEVYYQPQVDNETARIIGFEALLRWNHPFLGRIGPAAFMKIAEKTGLIVEIGEWVLRTACIQNKQWQDRGLIHVPIAVNLSIEQFYEAGLVNKVVEILRETGLHPSDLELEITESAFMKEREILIDSLKEIQKADVRIAIDDFGTEYSSLSYLKSLPVDRVKIAREFVMEIGLNKKDDIIVQTIVELLHSLHFDVIAEGVENEMQNAFLKTIKCNAIQGYYFYKPMPASQIEEILMNLCDNELNLSYSESAAVENA